MPTDTTGSDEPQLELQAQGKTAVQPATEQLRRPMPPVNLRKATQWPSQPPRPEVLLATIRKLSKARRISYMTHGDARWQERFTHKGFDFFDLYTVLEKGYIDGKIEAGMKQGEWKTKVVDVPKGTSRKMGVVTIVVREKRLLIKTVEWEDK